MATPEGDIRRRIDQEIRDFQAKAEAVRKRIRAVEETRGGSCPPFVTLPIIQGNPN
jgi:hypothetical protein